MSNEWLLKKIKEYNDLNQKTLEWLQQVRHDKSQKINNEIYELVNEDKKTYTSKDIVKRLNRIILLLHGEKELTFQEMLRTEFNLTGDEE
jgi:hypothetical protein